VLSGRCTYHPDRNAVGVCVVCRTVICIECSTPIDGIHRCFRCVAALGTSEARPRWEGSELHLLSLGLVATAFGGLTLLWMGVAAILR
jgi:hypothetical protein